MWCQIEMILFWFFWALKSKEQESPTDETATSQNNYRCDWRQRIAKGRKIIGQVLYKNGSWNKHGPTRQCIFTKKSGAPSWPINLEQVLKSNNLFLTTVAMVPVNLEYAAWFVVINANQTSDMEPISLYDHLLCQPWFLWLEAATRNKMLIVTTKPNLPDACSWIDANLETMICKSIPLEIEPPPLISYHTT